MTDSKASDWTLTLIISKAKTKGPVGDTSKEEQSGDLPVSPKPGNITVLH